MNSADSTASDVYEWPVTRIDGCAECCRPPWPLLRGIYFCTRCRHMWTVRQGHYTGEIVRTGHPPSKTAAP